MDRIEKIEASIEHAETKVKLAQDLLDLYDDPRFQKIVVKMYLEQEPVRLVSLYGSGTGSAEQLREVEKDMHGIGSFRRFLTQIIGEGRQAKNDLQANKEALEDELAMQAEARANGEDIPVSDDADYAGSLGA